MHTSVFVEISSLLVVSALVSMVMRALKQPMIIAYVITGLIVGPSLLGLVQTPETMEVLANFGVALLLFIIGLGLNPRIVKEVGKVSLIVGAGQILFTTVIGYILAKSIGYNSVTSLYIATAFAFSSTIIILKLLSDKKEQNKLFGKIAMGLLLLQDIAASFALLFAAAASSGQLSYQELLWLAVKGILLVSSTLLFTQIIIKPMTNFFAKSQELLFLFAIAWGFGIATLFYSLGFSLEVGALFAGVCLASMTYAQEAASRLRPLRDFFIIVFFIALGARINLSDVRALIWQAIALSLFILIGKPIIVAFIMGVMGYTKKTSFKTAIVMTQISEFSLILVLIGVNNGQISTQAASLVTAIGVITIAISTYLITFSDGIYATLDRFLPMFERKKLKTEREQHHNYDAILFGYKRGGIEFVNVFGRIAKKFIVIDYDPEAIDELERKQIAYIYGDATDLELLDEISFDRVKLVVSVISDYNTNVFLLEQLQKQNPHAVIVCHADTIQQAVELYGLGASFVVMPHFIGNEKVSAFIRKNGFKKSEFNKYREKHLEYLQNHFEGTEA